MKFYAKPAHIKKGFGKYCSNQCHYKDARKGRTVNCDICKKKYIEHKRNWTVPKVKSIFAGNRVKLNGEIKNFPGKTQGMERGVLNI